MTCIDIERTIRAALREDKTVTEISRDVMGLFDWHLENSNLQLEGHPRPVSPKR